MSNNLMTGRKGLAPTLLTVVIVWALAAVLMLTGTILAARRIDSDVKVIKPEVSDIGTDSRGIALAMTTANTTTKILKAAAPLTGELDETLTAARAIDKTAKTILVRARDINGTAKTINGNVLTINSTVNSIASNVDAIEANARSINASARDINRSALSINASAGSIGASVRGIDSSGRGILSMVVHIDGQVAGINRRAVAARAVVGPIRSDLNKVLGLVRSILSHANSIDCSTLISGNRCNQAR